MPGLPPHKPQASDSPRRIGVISVGKGCVVAVDSHGRPIYTLEVVSVILLSRPALGYIGADNGIEVCSQGLAAKHSVSRHNSVPSNAAGHHSLDALTPNTPTSHTANFWLDWPLVSCRRVGVMLPLLLLVAWPPAHCSRAQPA